jgi:hypothetical protein
MATPRKPRKKENQPEEVVGPIPFEDALKRVWRSPPKHKTARKGKKKEEAIS